jgi:hypothetical protein
MPQIKKGTRNDDATPTIMRTIRSGLGASQPRTSFGGSGMARQLEELNNKFDEMLDSQKSLRETVENLNQTVRRLEEGNRDLLKLNRELQNKNVALADKLRRAETTVSTVIDELETQKQRFLNDTVEILGATVKEFEDPLTVVQNLGQAVECHVDGSDVSDIHVRTVPQRKGPSKQKIIVTFVRRSKRMDFYHKCRKFRLSRQSDGAAELRKMNVVDALTYYKKMIYFEIIERRKQHPDTVKNIWVNDGEICIKRFGNAVVEPVKNMAFIDVIFDSAQPPPVNINDDDDDDAGHLA